jgi:hypothetical protein
MNSNRQLLEKNGEYLNPLLRNVKMYFRQKKIYISQEKLPKLRVIKKACLRTYQLPHDHSY